jgi:hypothetical protein
MNNQNPYPSYLSNYTFPQYISTNIGLGYIPQSPYDLSGVKYKTKSDILTLQRQWDTFNRVQSANFSIYLKILKGEPLNWYVFANNQEATNYRNGQQLHTIRYPYIPPALFQSVSIAPIPTSRFVTGPPRFSQVPSVISPPPPIKESQKTENNADISIYRFVSSYNVLHSTFTYQFQSNEEMMAYYRGLRLLTIPPPIVFGEGVLYTQTSIDNRTYYIIRTGGTFKTNIQILNVQYFMVGGGGCAGGACGGGAGGLLTNTSFYTFPSQKGPPNISFSAGATYTVTIGGGGAIGNYPESYIGGAGGNTILSGTGVELSALGGGQAGWTSWYEPQTTGFGCGGGGGYSIGLQGGSTSGANGAPGGNAGGGIGGNNVDYSTPGPGITYNGVTYGVGGAGGVSYNTIINGAPNTGNGGAGGGSLGPPEGPVPVASGGSGILILSF